MIIKDHASPSSPQPSQSPPLTIDQPMSFSLEERLKHHQIMMEGLKKMEDSGTLSDSLPTLRKADFFHSELTDVIAFIQKEINYYKQKEDDDDQTTNMAAISLNEQQNNNGDDYEEEDDNDHQHNSQPQNPYHSLLCSNVTFSGSGLARSFLRERYQTLQDTLGKEKAMYKALVSLQSLLSTTNPTIVDQGRGNANWQIFLTEHKIEMLKKAIKKMEDYFPLQYLSVNISRKAVTETTTINKSIPQRLKIKISQILIPSEEVDSALEIEEKLYFQLWNGGEPSELLKVKKTDTVYSLLVEGDGRGRIEIVFFDRATVKPIAMISFKMNWLNQYLQESMFSIDREEFILIPDGSVVLSLDVENLTTKLPATGTAAGSLKKEDRRRSKAAIKRERVIKLKSLPHLGHEFQQKNTLFIRKCSYCQQMIYRNGLSCSKCLLSSHRDCMTSIFQSCMTDAHTYTKWEGLQTQLKQLSAEHSKVIGRTERILTPTFCSHCGLLIQRNEDMSKCTTCGDKWHLGCEVFVPPFCSLKRSIANNLLKKSVKEYEALQAEDLKASLQKSNIHSDSTLTVSWETSTEDDYEKIAVIGKGNFGKVFLVRQRTDGRLMAMKVLKKEKIIANDERESLLNERHVFMVQSATEGCPFLVECFSIFQNKNCIFFVMEYVAGGDLMFHIQKGPFTLDQVAFLASQILLALEFLHSKNIVYRDLKLDNVLLTLDGHVKLADYGLCKGGMSEGVVTNTFCGTPEFIAPEILHELPYTKMVDWWAYGVLLYELLFSEAPFKGDSEGEIFKAILHAPLHFYPCPSSSKDIINSLLNRNPLLRLGVDGASSIKRHPFFANIDWEAMAKRKVKAPLIPCLENPVDVSNFDREFTVESAILTPPTSTIGGKTQQGYDVESSGPAEAFFDSIVNMNK